MAQPLTEKESRELEALASLGGPEDGGHVTFQPTPGREDLGGRVGAGLRFAPDGRGGGRLYAGGAGSRLVARVRCGP